MKVHVVTNADMHREPMEAWRADRLKDEIKSLRLEIVRLKQKCGEDLTLADLGFSS